MKILIIRFSSIGDIVLTTPVVRCLRLQLKEVEIHYLTKKAFVPLLESNPYIHTVHFIEGSDEAGVFKRLKKEQFDYVIDLHHNLRSARVKSVLRVPSFSFHKLNVKKWLLVNFKINRLPSVHIVDRYMKTVEQLNVTNDLKGLDYFIPEPDVVNPEQYPLLRNGYIAFVIGAKLFTKQLPVEKIIAACRHIHSPIVLLGGKEDETKGRQIKEAVGDNVINACGQYNLSQSASLLKQAKKVITHDTGLMHIAAAFKKDVLSIWGNTIPELGMTPYLAGANSKIVEVAGLSCRPCSKIGYKACPKKHFNCMQQIDVEQIVAFANA